MLYGAHQQPLVCNVVCCSMVQTDLEAAPCCMSRQASRGPVGSPLHVTKGLASALHVCSPAQHRHMPRRTAPCSSDHHICIRLAQLPALKSGLGAVFCDSSALARPRLSGRQHLMHEIQSLASSVSLNITRKYWTESSQPACAGCSTRAAGHGGMQGASQT